MKRLAASRRYVKERDAPAGKLLRTAFVGAVRPAPAGLDARRCNRKRERES